MRRASLPPYGPCTPYHLYRLPSRQLRRRWLCRRWLWRGLRTTPRGPTVGLPVREKTGNLRSGPWHGQETVPQHRVYASCKPAAIRPLYSIPPVRSAQPSTLPESAEFVWATPAPAVILAV